MSRTSLINSNIGDYRLVEKLGEGGMGEVYQGVHSKIGRVVAVKILSQGAHGPEFVERFLNEARIQGGLQHNNIVTLYDFLEYNGQPCIIMEFIEGSTLTDCIRTWGGIPLQEAIRFFQSIVEAIDYVHSRGIIHRDIKSNNVKITPAGQVKLLDFGIAKSGASPALTVTGAFVGTLQYLSPEQLVGGIADVRSDIWSLGVLFYEMTTAHLPFDANTIGELCQKITKATYTPPTVINQNVPRDIQNVIGRCLKRNPNDRYQSARDLLQDLNKAAVALNMPPTRLEVPGITAPGYGGTTAPAYVAPVSVAPAPRPSSGSGAAVVVPRQKSMMPLVATLVGILILVAVGVGLYFFLNGESPTPTRQSTIQPVASQSTTSSQNVETYTLDVAEGRAEVYSNGVRVGDTSGRGYRFQAKAGEQFEFVLKQEGYQDKQVRLTATENKKMYTYMMEKKY